MHTAAAKETGRPDRRAEPALSHLPSHICFWTVAGAMLWLDLWSKHWAFDELASNEIRSIIPGVVDLRRSLNDGAVFGSFTGYTGVFIVASVFALGFVFYLFAHSTRTERSLHVALALILAGAFGNLYDRAFVMADVLNYRVASGEPASLIGRIVGDRDGPVIHFGQWPDPDGANTRSFASSEVTVLQRGVVRDFIKLVPRFPAWVPRLAGRDIWPWVFNVADAALVCGVGMLLINTWLGRERRGSLCRR